MVNTISVTNKGTDLTMVFSLKQNAPQKEAEDLAKKMRQLFDEKLAIRLSYVVNIDL